MRARGSTITIATYQHSARHSYAVIGTMPTALLARVGALMVPSVISMPEVCACSSIVNGMTCDLSRSLVSRTVGLISAVTLGMRLTPVSLGTVRVVITRTTGYTAEVYKRLSNSPQAISPPLLAAAASVDPQEKYAGVHRYCAWPRTDAGRRVQSRCDTHFDDRL